MEPLWRQNLRDLRLKRMCGAVGIRQDDDGQALVDIGLHYSIESGDRAVVADDPPAIL